MCSFDAAQGFVACPVCGMSVKAELVNAHIDVCLSRQAADERRAAGETARPSGRDSGGAGALQRVPKRNFALDKEATLRSVLRKYRLPTTGTKATLVARYREFQLR